MQSAGARLVGIQSASDRLPPEARSAIGIDLALPANQRLRPGHPHPDASCALAVRDPGSACIGRRQTHSKWNDQWNGFEDLAPASRLALALLSSNV
jgi:hypothetical protein